MFNYNEKKSVLRIPWIEGYYPCCITYQISITKMSSQGHWVKDCFVFEFTIQPLVPTCIENLYHTCNYFKIWKISRVISYFPLWCFSVRSGQVRNLESARVSMVGQLKRWFIITLTHNLKKNNHIRYKTRT